MSDSRETHRRIREAEQGDAGAIASLVTDVGYTTDPAQMHRRLEFLLNETDKTTLVAEAGGHVVGVAAGEMGRRYEKDGVFVRLVVLAVAPGARGSGTGRALVAAIERWGAGRGAREIFVNSGSHRDEAHRFYEGCGYRRTGFRFAKAFE